MSILFLPLGIIYENLFSQDYWTPISVFSLNMGGTIHILLESLLFSFAIVGIAAVIYQVIFNKKLVKFKESRNEIITILSIIIIGMLIVFSLFFLGIKSIFATSISSIIISLFIVIQRKDLLVNALVSGMIVMITMFFIYYIGFHLAENAEDTLQQIWLLYGTSLGFRVLGVPITEMIWGFATGMFFGPLYAFVKGMRTV